MRYDENEKTLWQWEPEFIFTHWGSLGRSARAHTTAVRRLSDREGVLRANHRTEDHRATSTKHHGSNRAADRHNHPKSTVAADVAKTEQQRKDTDPIAKTRSGII